MPVISRNNAILTVIFNFETEPENQQKLLDLLKEALETTTRHQPGFVSASLHKSLDGLRVFNYAQWRTQTEYERFATSLEDQAIGEALSAFPLLGARVYEVVIAKPDDSAIDIRKGGLVHLGEFKIKPENQLRLVELERQHVSIALRHPDLLSVNFHRSLDGTATVNYGQWRNLDHFEDFLNDPQYEPIRTYWKGLAENDYHLYEVDYTDPDA